LDVRLRGRSAFDEPCDDKFDAVCVLVEKGQGILLGLQALAF
jgi:hypothetical protein